MSSSSFNDSRTIAINALSAVSGGGLSVARGLSSGLGVVRPNWKILFFGSHIDAFPQSPPSNVEVHQYSSARSPMRRWAFEQLVLPGVLSRKHVDAMLLLGGFKVFASSRPQASVWQNAHIWSPPAESHTWRLTTYIALQKRVMRATVPRVARNIFLSTDSAIRCKQELRIPNVHFESVPIGLDEAFIGQPAPLGLHNRDPVVLAVGDIYAHKRFELAIDALSALHTRHQKIELWIAGRIIDRRCYDRLTGQIERHALQGRVRFLGHVPRDQLIRLYRSTSLLIASSRLETFGLTPIEAMSCGLPVVACAESAVPEVCGEAACYSEASGASIAAAIDRLLVNPTEWTRFQERGLHRSPRFTWPVISERYAKILEAVLDDH